MARLAFFAANPVFPDTQVDIVTRRGIIFLQSDIVFIGELWLIKISWQSEHLCGAEKALSSDSHGSKVRQMIHPIYMGAPKASLNLSFGEYSMDKSEPKDIKNEDLLPLPIKLYDRQCLIHSE